MEIRIIILHVILLFIQSSCQLDYKTPNNVNRYQLHLIESSLDATTDPCENFYQYACGNWDKVHTDISKYHDYYRMIEYNTNIEMAKLLAKKKKSQQNNEKEPHFIRTAKVFYSSCVALKRQRFLEYLKWLETNENINMMLQTNSTIKFDWVRHLAIMNKYGLTGLFLDEIFFKRQRKLKLNNPLESGVFKPLTLQQFYIINLKIYGKKTVSGFSLDWLDVYNFEQDLMKLQALENCTRKSFTLADLEALPWLHRYVTILLKSTKLDAQKDMKIVLDDMTYIKKLSDFLQSYNQKFLCEYLKIRFLWHLIKQTNIRNISPESCALKVRTFMYLATDYLFEQQHKDLVESIPKIQVIFSNIKKHYAKVLLANPNGFEKHIIKFLLDKLNSTKLVVGLLPRHNAEQILETVYNGLSLNETSNNRFYGNQMQLLKFNANSSKLMRLITVDDASQYLEHTKRLSPYFIRLWNTVVLPITTLQMPIYDASLVDFFTYSSLGYILGHEITHGFDTMGTKRDSNGRYIYSYHEVINENSKYQQNLNCLRRLKNGKIDEKISDVTGFRVAYQTYFELNPQAKLKSVQVNGMNLTLDKVFFLNYAQFRCSSSQETPFQDDEHGTHEDRTVDAISHFPEFVKAFDCPKYTDMFLEKHCQLWRK